MGRLWLGVLLTLLLVTELGAQELSVRELGRIGALHGRPEELVFRVFDGALDSTGVWIAHRGDQQIKRYSLSGDFVSAIGGPGEGPGEFQGLTHLQTDSLRRIYAIDRSRLTVFDSTGNVLQTKTLDLPDYDSPLALVRGDPLELIVSRAGDPRLSTGLFRDSVQVIRKIGGAWVPVAAAIPSMWWETSRSERAVRTRAFADGPRAVVGVGGFIVAARENAPEVDVRVADESRSWESPGNRPVRSSEVDGERFFESVSVGNSRFVIGEAGLRAGLRRWWVVDQAATTLGWLELSPSSLVLDVFGRTLLVRDVGEFDEEYLRILQLDR